MRKVLFTVPDHFENPFATEVFFMLFQYIITYFFGMQYIFCTFLRKKKEPLPAAEVR
jgi:hypothetical protein